MKRFSLKTITSFLRIHIDDFAEHVETECELDGTEAESIIEDIEAAIDMAGMETVFPSSNLIASEVDA
jgi:hypothetical protein